MKILSLNSGSSTLKFALYSTNPLKVIYKNQIETSKPEKTIPSILKELKKKKLIQSDEEITKVGHRIVHGGKNYTKTTLVTPKIIKDIAALAPLAPLHNPINLRTLGATQKALPKAINYAIFDTAFYASIPEKAFLYAIPYQLYEKHHIRRYGFHGINHAYVVKQALKLETKKSKKRIISCHLGNGSSITASLNGKALDTSMGFTPLEGLPMGTRCGSIDPGIIIHLSEQLKMPIKKINEILNHKSGILGLSNISSDMRKVFAKYKKNNTRAILTIELLAYQAAKIISSYLPALGGLDTLVFTGGMGEHASYLREKIANHLKFLGLSLNPSANTNNSPLISAKTSKVKILIIAANEELEMAEEIA